MNTPLNKADLPILKQLVMDRMFCETKSCRKSLDYQKAVMISADYGHRIGLKENIICSDCFDDPSFQEWISHHTHADMIKAGKLRFIDARRFNKQGNPKL